MAALAMAEDWWGVMFEFALFVAFVVFSAVMIWLERRGRGN